MHIKPLPAPRVFRKKHSTSHALNYSVDHIQSLISSKKHVLGIFIDLSKAFDTLDHSKLISKLDIINKLRFRIRSVLKAKKSRYILLNAPNSKIKSISKILPVLKSPTVLPLAKDGWSSLHSVINADKFWEVIDRLKEEGAEDILVCPIEKMVL